MSDGPHRSLPLRHHWKMVAESAAKDVYSSGEVVERLSHAVKCDLSPAVLDAVMRLLIGSTNQGTLFNEVDGKAIAALEKLRANCRGASADNALIDNAIVALTTLHSEAICETVVEATCENIVSNCLRSIEEHYLREAPDNARFIRARLATARAQFDMKGLTSELITPKTSWRRNLQLPKRGGIDEGPRL